MSRISALAVLLYVMTAARTQKGLMLYCLTTSLTKLRISLHASTLLLVDESIRNASSMLHNEQAETQSNVKMSVFISDANKYVK